MKTRVAVLSTLLTATLAGAPLAAHAAPTAGQPYTHLVTGHGWSTGGTYISDGGDIKLKLTLVPNATEVLVEDCESGEDLGDVQTFTKKSATHTLATTVPNGTCFLMLFHPATKTTNYQIKGTLTY